MAIKKSSLKQRAEGEINFLVLLETCPISQPYLQVKSRSDRDSQYWKQKTIKKLEVGQEKQSQRISLDKFHSCHPSKSRCQEHQFKFPSYLWWYEDIRNTNLPFNSSLLLHFKMNSYFILKTNWTNIFGGALSRRRSLFAIPFCWGPRAPQLPAALENSFCHTARNFCSHSKHWARCAPNKAMFKTSIGMCVYVRWLNGPAGW